MRFQKTLLYLFNMFLPLRVGLFESKAGLVIFLPRDLKLSSLSWLKKCSFVLESSLKVSVLRSSSYFSSSFSIKGVSRPGYLSKMSASSYDSSEIMYLPGITQKLIKKNYVGIRLVKPKRS